MKRYATYWSCCLMLFLVGIVSGVARADLATGLVAYYPFDGNADDLSGYGNNGIVSGAQLTEDRFGQANQAYVFDGIDDVITAAHSASLDITGPISLSCWTRSDGTYLHSHIVSKQATYVPEVGYSLAIHDSEGFARGELSYATDYGHDAGHVGTSNSIIDGQWHLLTMTYDGAEMRMYFDGQLQDSLLYSIGCDSNTAPLQIGYHYYPYNDGAEGLHNWAFDGAIDDVRIYNRALSQAEVASLVPEPGTMSLLALGGLALLKRRNK